MLHTSKDQRGQVYVPMVNVLLAIGCILLVVTFRTSDRLAAMYGLAVAATMLTTDIMFYVVATRTLGWKPAVALPLAVAFGLVDATFVLAGLPKFIDGAWVPVLVAAGISLVAVTWLTGRRAVACELRDQYEPIEQFLTERRALTQRPKGAVVLLSGDPAGVPFVKDRPWLAPLIAEDLVILLTVKAVPRPYVPEKQRVTIDDSSENFTCIVAVFGYMEQPRLAPILSACGAANLDIDKDTTSFVYANPVIVGKKSGGLPPWQRKLFELMRRLSLTLAAQLEIKANRRIELGIEVAV